MGSGDPATPSKAAPKASSAQEQTPTASSSPTTTIAATAAATAAVYPDWSGFQAYSPVPPHGFFPPVASSPQAHPYMWGQHLMPPYGTPPTPFFMYPHGGLYTHPSMPPSPHPFSPYAIPSPTGNPEASGAAPIVDGKSSEGKEKGNLKQSKGSLGNLSMITGKNNETIKTSGASANGGFSQSDESSSEGSSDGSDANSQNDSGPNAGSGQDPFEAGASQNGSAACGSQNGLTRTPSQGTVIQPMSMVPIPPAATSGGVVGPTTNLNIGMDYWGVSTPSQIAPVRGNVSNASVGGLVPSGQSIPSDLWIQDERELKRQKRKQSNRESARRSRLRKQAEYEELALRAESLKEENNVLRAEASRLHKDYEQLLTENNSLKEKLGEMPKGLDDSGLDRSGQHLNGDDGHGHVDSDAQPAQKDPVQSGH